MVVEISTHDESVYLKTDTSEYCLRASTIRQFPDTIPNCAIRKVITAKPEDAEFSESELETVARIFADNKIVPCNDCGKLIWEDDWAGYYARHQCKACNMACNNCGADLGETKKLVKREASVRLGNKYKCTACGHSWRGISTG